MDVAKRKVAPRINRKFGKILIIFATSDRSQENHHAITH